MQSFIESIRRFVGYSIEFPFIKHEAFRGLSLEEANLYKYMFAPDLQRQTLAIVGCFVGMGPDMPMAEMQCRVATKVFKLRTYVTACKQLGLLLIISGNKFVVFVTD